MEYLVLLVVAAAFGFSVFAGYRKGFVKIMLSLVASLVALLLAIVLVNPIAGIVKQSSAYESLQKSVSLRICGELEEKTKFNEIEDLIDAVKLPEAISRPLMESTVEHLTPEFQDLSQISAESIISDAVSGITDFILSLIVFLLLFIAANIVLRVIIVIADFATKLPGINFVNHILGAGVGALQGIIVIWIASMVLMVLVAGGMGQPIYEAVMSNSILSWIYNHNLLWNFVISML